MSVTTQLRTLALAFVTTVGLAGGAIAGGHGHATGGDGHVNGYTKADGTYVAPHMRSARDGDFSNNWTTAGNVNPYTGKLGTRTTPPTNSGGHLAAAVAPTLPNPSEISGNEQPATDTFSTPGSSLSSTRPPAQFQPAWAPPQQTYPNLAQRAQESQARTQAYQDRTQQQASERGSYRKSKGYDFNPMYMTAFAMDQKVKDIDRAAYWKQQGYDFNPEYMSAFSMDQKVKDISRANYWRSKGYSFDAQYMSAFSMDQKVHDIERAKYWKAQGLDFDPQYMSAFSMDLEAQRRMKQHQ